MRNLRVELFGEMSNREILIETLSAIVCIPMCYVLVVVLLSQ